MRAIIITRWSPENIVEVNKIGVALAKGEGPKEIQEAANRCKMIAYEIPYGQCCSVVIVEGDEKGYIHGDTLLLRHSKMRDHAVFPHGNHYKVGSALESTKIK